MNNKTDKIDLRHRKVKNEVRSLRKSERVGKIKRDYKKFTKI